MQTSSSETSEVLELIESKKTFRHYLAYWAGQQASLLGSSIVSFAIIWWLTIETQSELMLGIASLVSLGPFVIIAPISGVIADRFSRKTLLITFDALHSSKNLPRLATSSVLRFLKPLFWSDAIVVPSQGLINFTLEGSTCCLAINLVLIYG